MLTFEVLHLQVHYSEVKFHCRSGHKGEFTAIMRATYKHLVVCSILVSLQLLKTFVNQAALLTSKSLRMFGFAMSNHIQKLFKRLITVFAFVLLHIFLSLSMAFNVCQQMGAIREFLATIWTNARRHFLPCCKVWMNELPVLLEFAFLAKAKATGFTRQAIVSTFHVFHQITLPRKGLVAASRDYASKGLHCQVNRLVVV